MDDHGLIKRLLQDPGYTSCARSDVMAQVVLLTESVGEPFVKALMHSGSGVLLK